VARHRAIHRKKLRREGLLPPQPWSPPRHPPRSRPFSRAQAEVIRDEYAQGKHLRHLAAEFGVTKEKIIQVLDRWRWGEMR